MPSPEIDQKYLLQYLIALELWKGGLTQDQVCQRLHLSKTTVNDMLKGLVRAGDAKPKK